MAVDDELHAELQLLDDVISTPGLCAVVTDDFAARCGRFQETAVEVRQEIDHIMKIVHPQVKDKGM